MSEAMRASAIGERTGLLVRTSGSTGLRAEHSQAWLPERLILGMPCVADTHEQARRVAEPPQPAHESSHTALPSGLTV